MRRAIPRRPRFCGRATLAGAAVAVCLMLPPAAPAQPAAGEEDRVEQFLERLGLYDLQLRHMERETARLRDRDRRLAYARRLADLYAAQLLVVSDPKRAEEISGRIAALLRDNPAAQTPFLKVMLLQGEYNRAEALAAKWVSDPGNANAKNGAVAILARIHPELDLLSERLGRQYKELNETLEQAAEGPERTQKEKEANRLGQAAGRATFFNGWANYYLGLMRATGPGVNEDYRKARLAFRKLLGLEKADDELEAEGLGIDSEARARTVLGLALAEVACGDGARGEKIFRLLQDPATHTQVREELGYWQVWALLNAGEAARARQVAEREVGGLSDAFTPGRAALCALLIRDGKGPQADLATLGLRGLLRMRRFELARHLLARHGAALEGQTGFIPQWLQGQNVLERAERSKTAGDYQAAARTLAAALAAADANREPALAAQCRFLLGCCYYRGGELEKAVAELKPALAALQAARAETVPDAAWVLASAYHGLASLDERQQSAAVDALQAFQRDFPTHPNAKKVDGLVFDLKQDAVALEKLDPADPAYPDACLRVCRRYHGQWKRARPDGRDAAAAQLRPALDRYLGLADAARNAEGRLEGLLMAADLALGGAAPDAGQARERLKQAEPLASPLMPSSPLAAEFHYLRFRLAQATDDGPALKEEARWLGQHARGSAAERLALLELARRADAALETADAGRQPALRAEALTVYEQLVTALGDGPDRLRTGPNALLANSRLAALAEVAGRLDLATRQLDRILQAFPRDGTYLRRAGLAHFQAGQYDRARACWQTLVDGLPSDSDGWYEAKYYALASLARTDRAAGRQAFEQYRQAQPELGPERWKGKFQDLEKTLTP